MGHLGHGYFWLKLYKERSYKVGQLTIALYQYQDSVLLFCGKDYLSPEFVSIISEKSASNHCQQTSEKTKQMEIIVEFMSEINTSALKD